MTLLIDAAPLIALADRRDPMLMRVHRALKGERGSLVIPAPVTAEVDYLIQARGGRGANRPFLADLRAGRYQVECLMPSEYAEVERLNNRYAAFNLGLADLSIVVLAARFKTRTLLTFDERHFRSIEPLQGGRFTILPADEDSTGA